MSICRAQPLMPRGEFIDLVDGILRRSFGHDRGDRLGIPVTSATPFLPMVALARPATPVAVEMEVTVHFNLGS